MYIHTRIYLATYALSSAFHHLIHIYKLAHFYQAVLEWKCIYIYICTNDAPMHQLLLFILSFYYLWLLSISL
jgi:hypothetical protein